MRKFYEGVLVRLIKIMIKKKKEILEKNVMIIY